MTNVYSGQPSNWSRWRAASWGIQEQYSHLRR